MYSFADRGWKDILFSYILSKHKEEETLEDMVKTSRREELEEKAMEEENEDLKEDKGENGDLKGGKEEKGDMYHKNIHLGFHRDALAWLVVGLVIGHLL